MICWTNKFRCLTNDGSTRTEPSNHKENAMKRYEQELVRDRKTLDFEKAVKSNGKKGFRVINFHVISPKWDDVPEMFALMEREVP